MIVYLLIMYHNLDPCSTPWRRDSCWHR